MRFVCHQASWSDGMSAKWQMSLEKWLMSICFQYCDGPNQAFWHASQDTSTGTEPRSDYDTSSNSPDHIIKKEENVVEFGGLADIPNHVFEKYDWILSLVDNAFYAMLIWSEALTKCAFIPSFVTDSWENNALCKFMQKLVRGRTSRQDSRIDSCDGQQCLLLLFFLTLSTKFPRV